MANGTEVIKNQMEDTRASLTERLESLEQQVGDTVQSATRAVETVKETVQDTVDVVTESVKETVEAVKHTFDLPGHVRRHPWAMMGGAVTVGCLAGYFLNRATQQRAALAVSTPREHDTRERAVRRESPRFTANGSARPGLFAGLRGAVEPELDRLKCLAIGSILAILRDSLTKVAPEPVAEKLREILDHVAMNLGAEPICGSILGGDARDREANEFRPAGNGSQHHSSTHTSTEHPHVNRGESYADRNRTKMAGPMGATQGPGEEHLGSADRR